MFDVIQKARIENIKSFTPRMDLSSIFGRRADLFFKRTARTIPCGSWFKQGETGGQVDIYPGSRLHLLVRLQSPTV